jgi:hypothetical protein
MSAGPYLQVVGALCELGGLGTVAAGIADTREHFTDRPSIFRRAWARVVRAAAKLRRRRPQTVNVEGTGTMTATVSMKGRATISFGPWGDEALEERIERLRRAFEDHERVLNELDERIDGEVNARREADVLHERRVDEVHRELADLVREAAAGGLRLQTIGVLLFALGVVLGLSGNLMG